MHQRLSRMVGAALTVGLMGAVPSTDRTALVETGQVTGRIVFPDGASGAGVAPTDAVIYLVGDDLASVAPPSGTAGMKSQLDQQNITFIPHVLPVAVGTAVAISNNDAILHNVHTRSRENRPFNRAQLASMKFSVTFTEPEVVTVSCDVHSQMSAFIVVVPNAFFTQADQNGAYEIADVPVGTYQLIGWHEKFGTVTTDITITAGQATQAELKFVTAT